MDNLKNKFVNAVRISALLYELIFQFHKAMQQNTSFPTIHIQMIFLFSHNQHQPFLISLYRRMAECSKMQMSEKNKRTTISNDTLTVLNNLKVFQSLLYRFRFLRRRMLPRLFQFLYRIRGIIHRQS